MSPIDRAEAAEILIRQLQAEDVDWVRNIANGIHQAGRTSIAAHYLIVLGGFEMGDLIRRHIEGSDFGSTCLIGNGYPLNHPLACRQICIPFRN